jgi:hypothetical protein
MRPRIALGLVGIAVGVTGLIGILADRHAARERERVIAAQVERFRQREGSVTWEGRTFAPGDAVRVARWAGTMKPEETGARVEVDAGEGRTGVVLRGERRQSTDYLKIDPNEPIQIVRVRWPAQRWKENGRDRWLAVPEFESTIHVSYLERVRP